LYPAGINKAYWQATDSTGITTVKSQHVCVYPLVSVQKDQRLLPTDNKRIGIYLNGQAPVYPLTITYTLASSSGDNPTSNNAAGEVIITQGSSAMVDLNSYALNLPTSHDTITLTLNDSVNAGSKSRHVMHISPLPADPVLSFVINQGNEHRHVVAKDQGMVNISIAIDGITDLSGYQVVWDLSALGLNNQSNSSNQLQFSVTELAVGGYEIPVVISNSAGTELTGYHYAFIEVVEQLAALSQQDSDGDLIADIDEGYQDSDGDFIPDYLDRIDECNVLQQTQAQFDGYLIEGDSGICLRRGNSTIGVAGGGAKISNQDINEAVNTKLVIDELATNVGGIFDYIAYGSLTKDTSFAIAIPQLKPIPPNAVYRKLAPDGSWGNFVEDQGNSLWSTAGEPGYCPPPNNSTNTNNSANNNPWQRGLIAGYWCVQMILTDGGANDDDNEVNGRIVDPGGVAVLKTPNHQPVAVDDSAILNPQNSIIGRSNTSSPQKATLSIFIFLE